MKKVVTVSLFWQSNLENPQVSTNDKPGGYSIEANELLCFFDIGCANRKVGDEWVFDPYIFPIRMDPVDQPNRREFRDFPENHIDNLPRNLEEQCVEYWSYRIDDGIFWFQADYSYMGPEPHNLISFSMTLEDFALFYRNYSDVRVTKEPREFQITVW